MSTIMSAIGEATGMKASDDMIALGALAMAKVKATAYCAAILESASPEIRHLFTTHLQDSLGEHERYTQLAIKKGWYNANASAEEMVKQAVDQAKPALH